MDEKFNKEEVWGKCLLFIKNRIQETAFQTWFDGVQISSINNEDLRYSVDKGSIGPDVIDISKLYSDTGKFTYDPGFTSTAVIFI